MRVLGVGIAERVHLLSESAVGPLVIHLLLLFGGIADSTRVKRLHSVLAELRVRLILGGVATKHGHHLPASLRCQLGFRHAGFEQDLEQSLLLQLSQIRLRASDSLRVLDGWVQVHSVGLGALNGVS